MANYSRPASGFRFRFDGMKTNSPADALPEFKYPYAQNIRAYGDLDVQSRPQFVQAISGSNVLNPILSLEPTLGIYKSFQGIFNNNVLLDSGYLAGLGCAIMQFRPSGSPNAYDYVFDDSKSTKIYVPASGAPTVQVVGIAEPQTPPEACPDNLGFNSFDINAASWVAVGTLGTLADATRITDTVGTAFQDPASTNNTVPRYSLSVVTTQPYAIGAKILLGATGNIPVVIQDVIPAIAGNISIAAIKYYAGNTGKCVIVPTQMAVSSTTPVITNGVPSADNVLAPNFIGTLRRGSLVTLGATETVFVLDVINGPDGNIAFETTTTNTHVATETISGLLAIVVSFTQNPTLVNGQPLTCKTISASVTAGVGGATTNLNITNPFVSKISFGARLLQPQVEDYIHVSVFMDNPSNLIEGRIMFDVGDGSFTQNFYYFDFRTSDLSSVVSNTTTQLGAAQIVMQRALIDAATSQGAFNALTTYAGLQTASGNSQYSELVIPISALTRVGDSKNFSLTNTGTFKIQFNVSATTAVQFGSLWVGGGGSPDVGSTGTPYFYCVVPRSSVTHVIGNRSPVTYYGIYPRRQQVVVTLPSAAYDSQIDTWDIYRFGGTITNFVYIGSAPSSAAFFVDNLFDDAVVDNPPLSYDNLQPFPSIGQPIVSNVNTIVGNLGAIQFPDAVTSPAQFGTLSQLQNLLPGTLINIGNNVFTLNRRPTFVSLSGPNQIYLFQFVENAGIQNNANVFIEEPTLANQNTNTVFGPDSQGTFFAVGIASLANAGIASPENALRAGLIQWTNQNNPDGASDKNTKDLCAPSEPLINGVVLVDTPMVFSASRGWRGYAAQGVDGRLTYRWQLMPVSKGLVAEFGICQDGSSVYYVAVDGIRKTSGGLDVSITDDDLYNLFPHEGIFPTNVVYGGQTVFAPEYKFAGNMRLNVINGYLYFDYLDSGQVQRTLVYDIRRTAWSVDTSLPAMTIHAGMTLPASNNQIPASAVRNQKLFTGDTGGAIYNESSTPGAEVVSCVIVTREEMVGDLRANKLFGDAAVDCLASGSNITVTPIFYGVTFGTNTVITGAQTNRFASPPTINLLGEQIKRSMALSLSWTDTGTITQLFLWQISYVSQPEDISNRIGDWDDAGQVGAKFFQGFILEADTLNVAKNLSIRGGDDLAIKQTFSIQHNGQQQIAYSFTTPFIAHLVRYEPDSVVWRMFNIKWIFQPTPEVALNWFTQPTSHGLPGFQHIPFINFAYKAPAPVVLTITVDGVVLTINLPAVSAFTKVPVRVPPNKGLVFQYAATSSQGFQVWDDDLEILVGEHGRSGPYHTVKVVGSRMGVQATI